MADQGPLKDRGHEALRQDILATVADTADSFTLADVLFDLIDGLYAQVDALNIRADAAQADVDALQQRVADLVENPFVQEPNP